MQIYSCDFDELSQMDVCTKNFIRMINRSNLIISLDNYLEVTELQVNMDKFGEMIHNFWLDLKLRLQDIVIAFMAITISLSADFKCLPQWQLQKLYFMAG